MSNTISIDEEPASAGQRSEELEEETRELQSPRVSKVPKEQAIAENEGRAPLGQVRNRSCCRSRADTRDTDQGQRRVPHEELDDKTELQPNVENNENREGRRAWAVANIRQVLEGIRNVMQCANRGVPRALLTRALMKKKAGLAGPTVCIPTRHVPPLRFHVGHCLGYTSHAQNSPVLPAARGDTVELKDKMRERIQMRKRGLLRQQAGWLWTPWIARAEKVGPRD